jgi:hypothetical protein
MLKTIYEDLKVNNSVYGILFGTVLQSSQTVESRDPTLSAGSLNEYWSQCSS